MTRSCGTALALPAAKALHVAADNYREKTCAAGVFFFAVEPDGLIGKRISAARVDARLSQRKLAAELRISVRTLQNYEAGRFIPYRHLDALSRLLGRNPTWLLYGREAPGTDLLLAESREQRRQLADNVERLVELGQRLADNAGRVQLPPT